MADKEKSEVAMTAERLEQASEAISAQADTLKVAADILEEEVAKIKDQQNIQDDRLDALES